MDRRPVTLAVTATALVAVSATVAHAAWSTSGSGAAAATARSLAPATGQSAVATGQDVSVTWTDGSNPAGTTYEVTRNSTPAAVLACTASPCADNGAPTGTYSYSVRARSGASWRSTPATTGSVTVAPLVTQTASPSIPTLLTADDTGSSPNDHVTNVARPRFTGTAAAGSLVRLYRAGVEIGSVQLAPTATDWQVTPAADVAEGTGVAVTATAQALGQTMSAQGPARTVTFDRTAPTTPTGIVLANGGGTGSAYVNAANVNGVQVRVTYASSPLNSANDQLDWLVSSGAQGYGGSTGRSSGATERLLGSFPMGNLADGPLTATVRAIDPAGNSSGTHTNAAFGTKDVVAPGAPTITSPASGATGVDRSATISGRGAEGGGTVDLTVTRLDNSTVVLSRTGAGGNALAVGSASPFSWTTGALNGNIYGNNQSNRIDVTHVDAAGNRSVTVSSTFTST